MSKARSPKILFMGTPLFATKALAALVAEGFHIKGVVTRPDTKSGRGNLRNISAISMKATEHKIPVYKPTSKAELTQVVLDVHPELIIVAAYGMIVPKEVLDIPKYGVLNIHGSLLPKYRGASPITEAILNGDKETGITIMKMSIGMDEGDIISSYKIQLSDKDTTTSLTQKMAKLGAKAIVETIPVWISDKLIGIPQNEREATYCRKTLKEDGHIDWNKPAEQIERMVRAYQPWPTTYTFTGSKRITISHTRWIPCLPDRLVGHSGGRPEITEIGRLNFENNQIFICTGNGTLEILELQSEGKKRMSAKDYINGNAKLNKTQLK
jgi:methionyl-tRNA formyltransferase